MNEHKRRAVDEVLDDLIMSSGTDHEIADDLGVSADFVRARRRLRRQDLMAADIMHRARELAEIVDWKGEPLDLVRRVLAQAVRRAHARARAT